MSRSKSRTDEGSYVRKRCTFAMSASSSLASQAVPTTSAAPFSNRRGFSTKMVDDVGLETWPMVMSASILSERSHAKARRFDGVQKKGCSHICCADGRSRGLRCIIELTRSCASTDSPTRASVLGRLCMMLASRSYHSPNGCTPGMSVEWKMHPNENMSTDRLVLELEEPGASIGDASASEPELLQWSLLPPLLLTLTLIFTLLLPSDLMEESDVHRCAMTSGACHPTLPGPTPTEFVPPLDWPRSDESAIVLTPKLLCPSSCLPRPMSEIFASYWPSKKAL
mmetsp:Transcript_20721/g.59012  ORF Transcript_20721/g.59012 Transcript_20721/m.59012 type:complete len:282 (+) Transcript_20721:1481-2326(+)